MSKDSYGKICKHFGIDKVEESISHRQEKFVKRYSGYSNSLCHSISAKKEALIEIGCVVTSLVVGWLVVTRGHCGQTVHPRPIVTMEH